MTKQIGWQKYESMLKEQINSPFASLIATNQLQIMQSQEEEDAEGDIEDDFDFEMLGDEGQDVLVVPVPNNIYEQINLLTNYECWIGHTNFDITELVKTTVEKTKGVEILKVYSRYRFFVGIGKMFNFSNVRKDIEDQLA